MAVWWVFQNKSYERSRDGGYLWAPLLDKAGHKKRGVSSTASDENRFDLFMVLYLKILSLLETRISRKQTYA